MNHNVSIIIRTRNEERWITSCLDAVFSQSYKNFEVIVVDNNSTDKTLDKIKNYNISKILNIDEYYPGKALNIGIHNSKAEYIVCLSAHCIPTNENWLKELIKNLESNQNFAGVYGRQEPMIFSTESDKRDLMLIFGLDEKIQKVDSFFHNANSIIKRSLWIKEKFDENVKSIEDRVWAQKMLNYGFKIAYTPFASVYHYHGVHQDGNEKRLKNIAKVISENELKYYNTGKFNAKKMKIYAIIPIKGNIKYLNSEPLVNFTISAAKKSKFIDKVIISTDSKEIASIAKDLGAECPFIRPSYLSKEFINLEKVQKYSLDKIEELGYLPDLIVHLEESYPFRPDGMIDGMINQLLDGGFDSVIAAKNEPSWLWQENDNGLINRIDTGDIPRNFKQKTILGIHGLGYVTYPSVIRDQKNLGSKIGLYSINSPLANFEVRDEESIKIASGIFNNNII